MNTKKGGNSPPMKTTQLKRKTLAKAPGVVIAEGKGEVGVDVGE